MKARARSGTSPWLGPTWASSNSYFEEAHTFSSSDAAGAGTGAPPRRPVSPRLVETAVRDHAAVPGRRVLRQPAQPVLEVDVDDPEPLRVTPRPLEVVDQGPEEVAAHVRAESD